VSQPITEGTTYGKKRISRVGKRGKFVQRKPPLSQDRKQKRRIFIRRKSGKKSVEGGE